MTAQVSCVLLNWNGWQDTIACLKALQKIDYGNLRVIVVDNASKDGSIGYLRDAFPNLTLLENDSNAGFAAGNNIGIRRALEDGSDYIWLLNNDTEPTPDALSAMLRTAEYDERIGGVGSVLFYSDNPSIVQAWGGGRVNVWHGLSQTATEPKPNSWFDYMTAASLLVRRDVFQDIGLMDDSFFLYWEDVELGFRMRSKGWKLAVAADSHILHKENASTGGVSKTLDYFSTDTGARFLRKYSPFPMFSVFSFVSRRILVRVIRGHLSAIPVILRAWRASRHPKRLDPDTL